MSNDEKEKIISTVMNELGTTFLGVGQGLCRFYYRRKWWSFDYDIYLSFDNETIFVSVIGRTYGRGGFIDFGQTEQLRKKIDTLIREKLNTA